MNKKQFLSKEYTNALRGISMLLVLLGHIFAGGFGLKPLVALGGIGVFIFLFLSGYGLHESFKKSGLDGFWKKKLLRILIPYFVWIIIFQLVEFISPLSINNDCLFRIPRYWFIEYLPIWYILFYICNKWFGKYILTILSISAIVMFFVYPKTQSEQSLSFLCGVFCSIYKDKIYDIKKKKSIIYGCICFILGLLFIYIRQILNVYNLSEDNLIVKLISLIMKFGLGLFVIIFTYNITILKKATMYLSILGLASYELYIVHFPYFGAINNNIVLLILFLIQTALLTWILYILDNFIIKKLSQKRKI